jgi:hypothetical protein
VDRAVLDSPLYAAALGALCGLVGSRLGWRSRSRLALPGIQAAMGLLAFIVLWRARGATLAALSVVGWALAVTAFGLFAFGRDPARTDRQVLRAVAYRYEMLAGLLHGPPSARQLLRAHLRELTLFLVAAWVSANVMGLVLGAVLLNAMNAWVVRAMAAALPGARPALLVWPVWSIARVLGYIALGAAAAAPLLGRLGMPATQGEATALWVFGGTAIIADLALKLTFSKRHARALGASIDVASLDTAPHHSRNRSDAPRGVL